MKMGSRGKAPSGVQGRNLGRVFLLVFFKFYGEGIPVGSGRGCAPPPEKFLYFLQNGAF